MTVDQASSTKDIDSAIAYDQLSEIYDGLIPDPINFTDFYREMCGTSPKKVLYIGCGTGRLLQTLASDGHNCEGLDPSEKSVQIARNRLQKAGLSVTVQVDKLPDLVSPTGQFDVIIIAGGAFEYLLTTHDQIAALKRVKGLLAPSGCLVMDVSLPPFATDGIRGNYEGEIDQDMAEELEYRSSEVRFGYDHFHQLVRSTCHFYFESPRTPLKIEYVTRYTTQSEWQLLLEVAGLRGHIFGDFQRGPVNRQSSNLVITAERND